MSKPFAETFFSEQGDDRDRRDERLPSSDPLALFHRLPAPQPLEGDVAAMKAAVAELRLARELSRRSERLTGEDIPAVKTQRTWRLAAAAAALLSAALFLGGPGTKQISPLAQSSTAPHSASQATPANWNGSASHLPLIEDVDPRQAELIQFEDEGVMLVVVLAAGPV